jgi:FAD-dependent halogenase
VLARAGHDVVLLEREHHPRHQIGESLLPSTIHGACRLSGASEAVHAAGFVPKLGGTFRWGRRTEPWSFRFATTTLAEAGYAFQVERARFDQILFENARRQGVDAREGVEAIGVIRDGDRLAGIKAVDANGKPLLVNAQYVVDASGHGSRLAREVGTKVYSEFFRNVAVYGYFRNAGRMPAPRQGNIMTAAFDNGWCWFIPLSDELTSVGAVIDRDHAGPIGRDREAALLDFTSRCPVVSELLADAERVTEGMYGEVRVRKDWSYLNDSLVAPGALLVGDAACFIDPVFSSGVHLATYGGVLAARTIATALAGDIAESQCMLEFERRYRREFSVWYEFLLAFFDLNQDWDGYFWKARNLLRTGERGNEPFIRLIAGGGSAPGDFFAAREGLGDEFEGMIPVLNDETPEGASDPDIMRLNNQRTLESRQLIAGGTDAPLFDDGLVPTADGLGWAVPERAVVMS